MNFNHRLLVVSLAAVLAAPIPAADWPMWGGDADRNMPVDLQIWDLYGSALRTVDACAWRSDVRVRMHFLEIDLRILGSQFFVTPSDSLAIIAHYADAAIPFFRERGGQ